MTAHANRNHVVRAALESIGYQLLDVLEMMKRDAGVTVRTIHADGGATRNTFLMQFIADITCLEVAAAQMPECSPLGAALAGAVGMGGLGIDTPVNHAHERITYVPQMAPNEASRLHQGWKAAVRQVLARPCPCAAESSAGGAGV